MEMTWLLLGWMALKRFIVYTDYIDYKQDKEEKLQGAFIDIISVRSKNLFLACNWSKALQLRTS